jgi:hypothetical protein
MTPTTPANRTSGSPGTIAAGAAAMLFLAAVALVGPGGDFPLSDDWAFAWPARSLCTEGRLELLPWTGASMILQALWGAAACAVAGFSFETLRATTLLLALLTVSVVAAFVARHHRGARAGVLVAAVIALNPIFLGLAFTFMTDLPFTALATLAVLAAARRGAATAGSGMLAAAATLVRQPGLAVAGALALGASLGRNLRPVVDIGAWSRALLPSLLGFGAWSAWLAATGSTPPAMTNKVFEAFAIAPLTLINVVVRALLYLGLLTLPLTLAVELPPRSARRDRVTAGSALAAGGLLAFLWFYEGSAMPLLPNLIHDLGTGALTTRDTLFLGYPAVTAVGAPFTVVLTVLTVLGVARLAQVLEALGRDLLAGSARWFTLAALAVFATSLLQAVYYFDRYLLPVFVLAVTAIALAAPRLRATAAATAALVAYSAFALGGAHDTMAWNRARQELVVVAAARGIDFDRLDAGMDLNGWHNAARLGDWPDDEAVRPGANPGRKSWWWVIDDAWVLSFRELEGFHVVARRPWRSWLPPGEREILALERDDVSATGSRTEVPLSLVPSRGTG